MAFRDETSLLHWRLLFGWRRQRGEGDGAGRQTYKPWDRSRKRGEKLWMKTVWMTDRNGCKNGLLRDYEFTYLNREMHATALHQKKGKAAQLIFRITECMWPDCVCPSLCGCWCLRETLRSCILRVALLSSCHRWSKLFEWFHSTWLLFFILKSFSLKTHRGISAGGRPVQRRPSLFSPNWRVLFWNIHNYHLKRWQNFKKCTWYLVPDLPIAHVSNFVSD